MSRNVCQRVVLAVLLVLGWALPASAQGGVGSIVGVIHDTQGQAIGGATISLLSQRMGTRFPNATTSPTGEFSFENVPVGTFQVTIQAAGFRPLVSGGITVTSGQRADLGTLRLEAANRGAEVTLQARSGERLFTIPAAEVRELPMIERGFGAFTVLAPGVTLSELETPVRFGGGGDSLFNLDGVAANDTGSNRPLLQMNMESLSELQIRTQTYQAEFGRASGLQVNAITRSGTNRFSGSVYDVRRNSDWDARSKEQELNGDPKELHRGQEYGFSIGGPIGKPGESPKAFFFYGQEFSSRTRGGQVANYRMPTALERQGDFSKSTDANGVQFPYIKDPRSSQPCTAPTFTGPADTRGCFADGGTLGKIPQSQLSSVGLAILNRYPQPNLDAVPAGQGYNYSNVRGKESVLSWQPALRVDVQPTTALRLTGRYSSWDQGDHTFVGSVPTFNDTKMQGTPVSSFGLSATYALSTSTVLEAAFGRSRNELAGCAQAQSSSGAIFCDVAVPMNPAASLAGSGLANLPLLYPGATTPDAGYYAREAMSELQPAFWDGSRMATVPTFGWGTRVATPPPNTAFPAWLNQNETTDLSVSLSGVWGPHRWKGGVSRMRSEKFEQTTNSAFGAIDFGNSPPGANLFDTGFGFANAAIGSFKSFEQSQKYVEASAVVEDIEAFVQDNWTVLPRLTIDYGVRFVFQKPQYDRRNQASNFLPDAWSPEAVPFMYLPGCTNEIYPCQSTNGGAFRAAFDPLSGQFVGTAATASTLVGTTVPGSGTPLNGLFLPGQNGVPRSTYDLPTVVYAPRFGAAFDFIGDGRVIARGGIGMFYNRPASTALSRGINNPPTSSQVTLPNSALQAIGASGLASSPVPTLYGIQYQSDVPTSVQWNGGLQFALPWSSLVDVAYVGQHSYNEYDAVNINAIDRASTFLEVNQDYTLDPSTTPGGTALPDPLLRSMRGYGDIILQLNRGWRTHHSIQLSFQRRFTQGIALGFVNTIGILDKQQGPAQVQHGDDGRWSYSSSQFSADDLLGDNKPVTHTMRTTFVWDLPDWSDGSNRLAKAVLRDWQVAGVWTASTGRAYSADFSYESGVTDATLTGSPNIPARLAIVGDPGTGCTSNRFRQFDFTAFAPPPVGTDGFASGSNYLRGCFQSAVDVGVSRSFRFGGARQLQVRLDVFNLPNMAAITGRQTELVFRDLLDQTLVNAPFDPNGNPIPGRLQPEQAGVGVANAYQSPRRFQISARFQF